MNAHVGLARRGRNPAMLPNPLLVGHVVFAVRVLAHNGLVQLVAPQAPILALVEFHRPYPHELTAHDRARLVPRLRPR